MTKPLNAKTPISPKIKTPNFNKKNTKKDPTKQNTQSALKPSKKKPAFFKSFTNQKQQEKYDNLNKKYLLLMAEYANYQKNRSKQIEELRKYEGKNLIQSLLDTVIDNFDLALKQEITDQNKAQFKEGIRIIYKSFKNILTQAGITELDCKGQVFDPNVHSALDSISETDVPANHIVHIVKKAYLFKGKLIRPAAVIVSTKPEESILEPKQNTNEE